MVDDPSSEDRRAIAQDLEEIVREGRRKSLRSAAASVFAFLFGAWAIAGWALGRIHLDDDGFSASFSNATAFGRAMNGAGLALIVLAIVAAWLLRPKRE